MAEVEDYTTRSRLTITHESVSDSDVEAYYRHRRYVARHPPQPPVEDAATAKIKELTATLDAAVEELHSTEGNIQSWVSKEDARHCREAAAAGRLDDLLRIKEERHAWPKYLTMVSWDIKNPTGQTALVLAVTNDHLDCVRFLIDQGADPNIVDGNGDSPLHLAKSQSVAELLLANGANPAAIDRLERTPYELHVSKRFHRVHNEIEGKDVSHEVHNAFEAHQKVRSKSRKGFKLNEEQRQKQQAKVEKQLVEEQAARDKAAHDAIVERGEALFNKAKGLIALKDPDSAVASLAECLSLDPHHPQALRQLRELAAGGNETARAALAHMLHPNEQRPWVAPDAAGSVIAMDAQLLLEAGSIFGSMAVDETTGQKRGWVSFAQCSHKLADFGLEHAQIDSLVGLMDVDADGRISMDEFTAGYRRVVKLQKPTERVSGVGLRYHLSRRAESMHTFMRDKKFHAVKERAGDMSAEESRKFAVLFVSGIPANAQGFGVESVPDDAEASKALSTHFARFGYVLASVRYQDRAEDSTSCALLKFAMECSVAEAVETGSSTLLASGGEETALTLAAAGDTAAMSHHTRLQMRRLDLLVRGQAEQATQLMAHAQKTELFVGQLPDHFLTKAEEDSGSAEAGVQRLAEAYGPVLAVTVQRVLRQGGGAGQSWALVKFGEMGAAEAACEDGLVCQGVEIFDAKRGERRRQDVELHLRLGVEDAGQLRGLAAGVTHENLMLVKNNQEAQLMFRALEHKQDREGHGKISSYHFQSRLGELGVSSAQQVFELLDINEDGELTLQEWLTTLREKRGHKLIAQMLEQFQ